MKKLMNPYTGTIQTETEWLDDFHNTAPELWGGPEFTDAELIEVREDEYGTLYEVENVGCISNFGSESCGDEMDQDEIEREENR